MCFSPTVEDDGSCKKTTTENCHEESSVTASKLPLPVPTIHIEMSESSEQYDVPSYEPEKLQRVDKPLLRTPRVAGGNMLLIQHADITYGSPKLMKRRHTPIERTLSDNSCRSRQMRENNSPAVSIRSSRASSADRSRVSSASRRSADCDYMDDFDESSDIDEGFVAYFVFS